MPVSVHSSHATEFPHPSTTTFVTPAALEESSCIPRVETFTDACCTSPSSPSCSPLLPRQDIQLHRRRALLLRKAYGCFKSERLGFQDTLRQSLALRLDQASGHLGLAPFEPTFGSVQSWAIEGSNGKSGGRPIFLHQIENRFGATKLLV